MTAKIIDCRQAVKKLHVEHVTVDGVRLRVGIQPGDGGTPLVLFNGIGANMELALPFFDAMKGVEIVAFDAPGIGGSELDLVPRRFRGLARLVSRMLDQLGYREVDAAGVSWGGALAQQFAKQHADRCRRLVLAATSAGAFMMPGRPSVLLKMATPRRYLSRDYMHSVAGDIYGGEVRGRPELVAQHVARIKPPSTRGYVYQLLAGWGWTSIHWLHRLSQPTLVLAGDDDPLVPVVNARLMAAFIPHSRLHIVEGGGHLFLLSRAHELAPLIKGFLRGDSDPAVSTSGSIGARQA
jgi:poly(3-hydroxyalkanoate) depolymerase